MRKLLDFAVLASGLVVVVCLGCSSQVETETARPAGFDLTPASGTPSAEQAQPSERPTEPAKVTEPVTEKKPAAEERQPAAEGKKPVAETKSTAEQKQPAPEQKKAEEKRPEAGKQSSADSIRGDYLEARNAHLWAGPSVANSEIGLVGEKAILAWKVREGTYQGARLDGLAVVAVVFANGTLGAGEQVQTRTTFLVDARAGESQQAALVAMAKALAGDSVQVVVAVRPVRIDMNVYQGCAIGYAVLEADTLLVRTRRILESDKSECGRLKMAYPGLAQLYYRYPAFTLEYSYSGRDFEDRPVRFVHRGLPGAMVGDFAL